MSRVGACISLFVIIENEHSSVRVMLCGSGRVEARALMSNEPSHYSLVRCFRDYFIKPPGGDARFTHLSQIAFSHISNLDYFQYYCLAVANDWANLVQDEAGAAINDKMVSYIIRRLMPYDISPFEEGGGHRHLVNNCSLPTRTKTSCAA